MNYASVIPLIPLSLILLPFHKPRSCFPSLMLPLYLLTGGPRLRRGGRRGGGNACCFLIIIGVFMVILLLIKVLREIGRIERWERWTKGWVGRWDMKARGMKGEECMKRGKVDFQMGGEQRLQRAKREKYRREGVNVGDRQQRR